MTSTDYASKFEIPLAATRKDLNELFRRRLIRRLGGGRNTRYATVE